MGNYIYKNTLIFNIGSSTISAFTWISNRRFDRSKVGLFKDSGMFVGRT